MKKDRVAAFLMLGIRVLNLDRKENLGIEDEEQ